jgi:hypothetical protein
MLTARPGNDEILRGEARSRLFHQPRTQERPAA